jgi:hypothetical protein
VLTTPCTSGPNLGVLFGRVKARDTSEPEEGVRVFISKRQNTSERREALTDAFGRFAMRVPDGDWTVSVTMPSGRVYSVSQIIVSNGQITDEIGRDVPSLVALSLNPRTGRVCHLETCKPDHSVVVLLIPATAIGRPEPAPRGTRPGAGPGQQASRFSIETSRDRPAWPDVRTDLLVAGVGQKTVQTRGLPPGRRMPVVIGLINEGSGRISVLRPGRPTPHQEIPRR